MKVSSYNVIIVLLIMSFLGFLIGRLTVNRKVTQRTIVEYEKGDTIRDTLKIIKPYKITEIKSDTIFKENKTDTVKLFKIWKDYYKQREYNLDFSNDSIGVFKVNLKISQNKILNANSIITPVVKIINKKQIINKKPLLQFFGLIGFSTDMNNSKIQFGIDFKQKYILSISSFRIKEKNGYTIDFGIKF